MKTEFPKSVIASLVISLCFMGQFPVGAAVPVAYSLDTVPSAFSEEQPPRTDSGQSVQRDSILLGESHACTPVRNQYVQYQPQYVYPPVVYYSSPPTVGYPSVSYQYSYQPGQTYSCVNGQCGYR